MENFLQHGWGPIGKAFLEFGDRAGLDATTRWFYQTPFDSIPKELRKEMLRNVKEWRALATASDAYPLVDTARVKNLKIPTLLLSGSRNAGKINGLIDGELSILLPDNRQAIIPNAGHEMFQDNPGATNQAIVDFLKKP
jgi:pimeloyl-ACP methyl ester carboxylesterase